MFSNIPFLNPQLHDIHSFLFRIAHFPSKQPVLNPAESLASASWLLNLCVKRDYLTPKAAFCSNASTSKKSSYCSMVLYVDELLLLEKGWSSLGRVSYNAHIEECCVIHKQHSAL